MIHCSSEWSHVVSRRFEAIRVSRAGVCPRQHLWIFPSRNARDAPVREDNARIGLVLGPLFLSFSDQVSNSARLAPPSPSRRQGHDPLRPAARESSSASLICSHDRYRRMHLFCRLERATLSNPPRVSPLCHPLVLSSERLPASSRFNFGRRARLECTLVASPHRSAYRIIPTVRHATRFDGLLRDACRLALPRSHQRRQFARALVSVS